MSTVDPVEFEKLKTEVAELRALVAKFLTVTHDDAGNIATKTVNCDNLHTHNFNILDKTRKVRAFMGVNDHGPFLIFRSEDEKKRLQLRACDDFGEIFIYGDDGKATVQILTDNGGHGNVMVHSPGAIPRAGMKGTDTAGVISVCSPEGEPRAVMHSTDGKGEVAILNPDLHLIARMSTADSGGTIGILDNQGRRACVLIPSEGGNALMVFPPGGNHGGATLMASEAGAMFFLGNDAEDRGGEGISLLGLKDGSGHIRLGSGQGPVALELGSDENGGRIRVSSLKTENLVLIKTLDEGGRIELEHSESKGSCILAATRTGASVIVAQGEHVAALQIVNAHGSFSIASGKHLQILLGNTDEHTANLLFTNPDNTASVNFFAGEHGGIGLLCGNDGTTQLGFGGSDEGGRLTIFSELGIERATLQSKHDGGGLNLKWGGTNCVIAGATEAGGCVVTYDQNGKILASLPASDRDKPDWQEDDDEDE